MGLLSDLNRKRKEAQDSAIEIVRKVVPNELADVAVKAAPFVAPFQPGIAAAMRGLGRLDQTGNLSDALKQGLGTYAMGDFARGAFNTQALGSTGESRIMDAITSRLPKRGTNRTMDTLRNLMKKSKYSGAPGGIPESPKTGGGISEMYTKATDFLGNPKKSIPAIMLGSYIKEKFFPEDVPDPYYETYKRDMGKRGRDMRRYLRQYGKFDPLRDPSKNPYTAKETQDYIDENVVEYEDLAQGGRIGYENAGPVMKDPNEVVAGMDNELNPGLFDKIPLIGGYKGKYPVNADQGASLIEEIQDYKYGKSFPGETVWGKKKNQSGEWQLPKPDRPPMSMEETIEALEAKWDQAVEDDLGFFEFEKMGIYSKEDIRRRVELGYDQAKGPEIKTGIMTAADGGRIGFAAGGDYENKFMELVAKLREAGYSQQEAIEEARKQLSQNMAYGGRTRYKFGEEVIADQEAIIKTPNKEIVVNDMEEIKGQMAGPDWYIKRIELLMDEYGYGYEEAGEIAYDSDKYYEVIGIDPGGIGDETRAPTAGQGIMQMASDPGIDDSRNELALELFGKPIELLTREEMDMLNEEAERLSQKFMAHGGRIKYDEGGITQMASSGSEDPLLIEEYNKYVYEMEEMGLQPMSFQQFKAQARAGAAHGGRMKYKFGNIVEEAAGIESLPINVNSKGIKELDLRDSGGFIPPVGVKEKADDVPAMLSNNEFVFTADAVRGAGGGDVEKGSKIMYDVMQELEKGGRV